MQPSPDAGPIAARRLQSGGTSARSVLITVLGEFVLPRGVSVWTRTLVQVLGLLGVEEKSARQSLARTAADGWLTSDRDGRRVRWSLTPAGRDLLLSGARRIYGFGSHPEAWDGQWLVLTVTVPETRRQLRARLRSQLAWAGLGSPAPGVWTSPDPGKEPEVAEVLAGLGLLGSAFSYVGRFGGIGRAPDVVRQAWDLADVEAGYEAFTGEFAGLHPSTSDELLVAQLRLVHAWRRFPFVDPQLPAELLPPRWAGDRAAEVFRSRHGAWSGPARTRWDELAGGADGPGDGDGAPGAPAAGVSSGSWARAAPSGRPSAPTTGSPAAGRRA